MLSLLRARVQSLIGELRFPQASMAKTQINKVKAGRADLAGWPQCPFTLTLSYASLDHSLFMVIRCFQAVAHQQGEIDTEQDPVGLWGRKAFLCPPFLDYRK